MECREFDSWYSQTNDLQNAYLSLPSTALGINRIGQGLVSTESWRAILGHGAGRPAFQSGSTIKSFGMRTATSQYPPDMTLDVVKMPNSNRKLP